MIYDQPDHFYLLWYPVLLPVLWSLIISLFHLLQNVPHYYSMNVLYVQQCFPLSSTTFLCRDSFAAKTPWYMHTPTPLCKLYSPVIGRYAAREGGAKPWLISIPTRAHKCAGSLTWCFKQRQTHRGGEGRDTVEVKFRFEKASSLTSQRHTHTHRSGHRPRPCA